MGAGRGVAEVSSAVGGVSGQGRTGQINENVSLARGV